MKGSPRRQVIPIGISSFGAGNVQFRKHIQSVVQDKLELNLSRAFLDKIKQIDSADQEWASLSSDTSNELHKVKTFRLDSSTDGYGFKIYKNNSYNPVTIQISGEIKGGKLSKNYY